MRTRLRAMRTRKPATIAIILVLLVYGLLLLAPLYWMFVTAFQGPMIVVQTPPELFPSDPTIENFVELFRTSLALRWTWNTMVVAGLSTMLYVMISAMSGYAFAKKEFPGKNVIFWMYMATMMVPYFSVIIPSYVLITNFKLVDTYAGLILPVIAGPFGSFLMKQYMASLPMELIHAARIDGCSEFGAFLRVVIPISKPGVTFLGIVTFISQWNNFLWPLLATNSAEMRMLQVGIATFQLQYVSNYGLSMAAAAFAAVPVILLFVIFQKHIIKGITIGALKG